MSIKSSLLEIVIMNALVLYFQYKFILKGKSLIRH